MRIIDSSTSYSIKSHSTEFDLRGFGAKKPVRIQSVADALIDSLDMFGKVDIDYIAVITAKKQATVIKKLGNAIFQNPKKWNENPNRGWETSDEYLSGNLFEKLKAATEANEKYDDRFSRNVEALKKIMPAPIKSDQIFVSLGSPWLPAHIIDDFIFYLLNQDNKPPEELFSYLYSVQYDEHKNKWIVPHKNRFNDTIASVTVLSTYGTERMNALHIIERTLNNRVISIKDDHILNNEETTLAIAKQEKIMKEFQRWIWADEHRKEELEQIYSEKFVYIGQRHFDGSFLTFPDMNPDIQLFQHQKNAVARILFSRNTLLAHEVGSGKTYTMIAAGMELRRIGFSLRNLYVVPNNIISEWERAFKKLYPKANIYCVSSSNCNSKNLNKVMQHIRDSDYDAIIMTHSICNKIKCKNEVKKEYSFTTSEITTSSDSEKTKILKSKIDKVEAELYFDDLDIDAMFVDEAHEYKNLRTKSTNLNIIGMSPIGAKKCIRMLEKVRCSSLSSIVFATGTPLSNSLIDIYVMQQYLQFDELKSYNLDTLNNWVNMFCAEDSSIIVDVDTSRCKVSKRFSKFANLPELAKIASQFVDYYVADKTVKTHNLPKFDGYTDILIPQTPELRSFFSEISFRADKIRSGNINKIEDNMLKITIDGRKAALDLRLVEKAADKSTTYKVHRCAEIVHETYRKYHANKCTQIVFCDISVPKAKFNIYDELRYLLIDMGIPGNEIAFIHDATTAKKRNQIFEKFRKGEIRILLGSTNKLGTGVNVQDKLVAIHHLDVPWKPSDMVQREGRILRQGNTNEKIEIFRYITEGSFDAYSWQILEQKQKFISDFLSGFCSGRAASDIGDTVLDYAQVKTLALNNKDLKLRFEVENQLNKYSALQKANTSNYLKLQAKMAETEEKIAKNEDEMQIITHDYDYFIANKCAYPAYQTEFKNKWIAYNLKHYEMHPEERIITNCHGFEVVSPANMTCEEPYILLKAKGKHKIKLKKGETNVMKKINRYLTSLDKKRKKLLSENAENLELISKIKTELANQEDYTEIIEDLRNMLKEADEEVVKEY